MIHVVTHVQDEVIEGVVGGVIVRVIKRHVVQLPVDILIDFSTREALVHSDPEQVEVSCLIVADVVGLAPEKPTTPAPDLRHWLPGYHAFSGYAN